MRKKPTYDWKWFESHTPFKKILAETCGLEIEKEVHKIPTIAGYYTTNNHYKIKVDYKKFENNFEEIKRRLLNTNVCKNNQEIFNYFNKKECNKRTLGDFVTRGCIKNTSGSFEWNMGEN